MLSYNNYGPGLYACSFGDYNGSIMNNYGWNENNTIRNSKSLGDGYGHKFSSLSVFPTQVPLTNLLFENIVVCGKDGQGWAWACYSCWLLTLPHICEITSIMMHAASASRRRRLIRRESAHKEACLCVRVQVTIDDTPCAVWGSDYSEHYAIWIDSNADSGNDPTTATVRWGS